MFDENNLPTVTIGCPLANRQYTINRYLDGIYGLDYPKDKIKLFFLLNNSKDDTEFELKRFKQRYGKEYLDVTIEKFKGLPNKEDRRVTHVRAEIYKKLSVLRNHVLDAVDTDFYFSVDSDIILNSDVLTDLIRADKDIIAAVVNNDMLLRPYDEYPNIRTNLLVCEGKIITHKLNFELNDVVEVDVTGACILMSNKVCKETRYSFHNQGEDVSWSFDAKEKGYTLYAHTGQWQKHIMCEYMPYCIENKCQNPCVKVNSEDKVYQYKYKDNVVYPNLIRCGKLVKGDKPLLENI